MAGLNGLIKFGVADHFKEQFLQFEDNVVHQNRYHIPKFNEFIVARLILPPKLCWFPDNGPPGYTNRLDELIEFKSWIKEFNSRGTRSWHD